ncbi:hypothetical protein S40285_07355 [Stachybotrys chlorohalonatus IBT 40285]|uniref:Uncharacterized protein n=1 Tax=Stachybotrys chlorohalonatus (strain IBT 40285) TaxID=1283841 RepID=A0A084Q9C5_STAC4|nr:hypothetical protein S40285_07355 [Stachybotrys chlorohalonata IBT 40285]
MGLFGLRRRWSSRAPGPSPATKEERPSPDAAVTPTDQDDGLKRRMSRRERFSVILGRTKKRGSIGIGTSPTNASTTQAETKLTTAVQRKPTQPPDHNKPLPSPPSEETGEIDGSTGKPILKLNRIMANLSEDELEKLFSGAPQFFIRSEGQFTGAPHPCVAFPFDEELEIRDMTDHVQIEAKAWSGVTAWPHLTREPITDATKPPETQDKQKAHFHIRCRERPNMLGMQGLEKGTMGFSAALELSVSDSLEEEQFGFDTLGTKARIIVETRERMISSKGFIHPVTQSDIMERLKRNSERYRDNDMRRRRSIETYEELFENLMRPSGAIVDKTDRYSLTNQINVLVKCLGTPNVWIDLSRVEWRIRLGQILWGEPDGDEMDDATSIHGVGDASERADEKYWLLMQILLATELLVRLDAVTEGSEIQVEVFRPIDVINFERAATPTVKWSLILARRWLENIEIVKEEVADRKPVHGSSVGGWLTSLASKISLYHHTEERYNEESSKYHYKITGRYGQRQVDGLLHFAKKLRWPGIQAYETRITESTQSAASEKPTPLMSPKPGSTTRSSYFGAWDVSSHHHQGTDKVQAQRRKLAAALHASGWISKSYVFGLVLPGEALSHYLMATLLENDSEAMSRLGSFANLCGGFVYARKSFWSTSCIVGRVLAAGRGSAECMGWVSTDVIPVGLGEGWVNIDVENVAEDMSHLGKKARLWGKKKVERESSIIGDGDENSVLPADFVIPHENTYAATPPAVYIDFQSLELLSPATSVQATPLSDITPTPFTGESKSPELLTYPADVNFVVSVNGEAPTQYTFSLSYDISFVTAHPCAPSSRVKILSSPSSPTIQQIDISGSDMLGKTSRPEQRTGHPLHKSYNYTVIHISELLQRHHTPLSELVSTPLMKSSGYRTGRSNQNQVLVVDCITNSAERPLSPSLQRSDSSAFTPLSPLFDRRNSFAAAAMHMESRRRQFGSDMEILVRALCAQKGWNAVISRKKRGCLACAIREAGALGWKIVIRVE